MNVLCQFVPFPLQLMFYHQPDLQKVEGIEGCLGYWSMSKKDASHGTVFTQIQLPMAQICVNGKEKFLNK